MDGSSVYASHPPFEPHFAEADLITGVLVGITDKTIRWLDSPLRQPKPRRVNLVIIAYPANPPREEHLLPLKMLQAQFRGPERELGKVRGGQAATCNVSRLK